MTIEIQQVVDDWKALQKTFGGLGLGVSLPDLDAMHLKHESQAFEEHEALRKALVGVMASAHGWLMLTDSLLQLPATEQDFPGIPLQGEWRHNGSSWQLRYVGLSESGSPSWQLHQYTVADIDAQKPATHIAEKVLHLKADGQEYIYYLRLWGIEKDFNDEPVPRPVLAVLDSYGEEE